MKQPKTSAPIRLAMRVEGDWWVAYLAETGTMNGAKELGRILISAARGNERVTEGFKALMRDVLETGLADLGMPAQSWSEQPAPESERSGRA